MAKKPARLGRGLNSLISSSLTTANPDTAKPDAPEVAETEAPHRISIAEDSTPPGASRIISELAKVQDRHRAQEALNANSPQVDQSPPHQRLLEIPVETISPNALQPRKSFDAVSIGRLARSIAESGVLQPLLVRMLPNEDPRNTDIEYELIAGERRWRAAKAAGIATVPAIVKFAETDTTMEMALVENIQREDLNAIDRARAYRAYCERTGMSAEDAGRKLGEDRSTISNYLRLLDLPDPVLELVESGRVGMGHARALLGCVDASGQMELAQQVATQGLSVRAVEKLVRGQKDRSDQESEPTHTTPKRPVYLGELEEKLQQAAKTKVKIQPGRGPHRGKIIIEYYSLDDFDRISAMLGYSEKDAQ